MSSFDESDWEPIKFLHHLSAVFRAVENGVPMLRATRWRLSAAVDPYGRVLAQLDPFVPHDRAMMVQGPVGGEIELVRACECAVSTRLRRLVWLAFAEPLGPPH